MLLLFRTAQTKLALYSFTLGWIDLGGWVGFQIGRPPDKLEIVKDLFIHERRFSLPKNLKLLASPNELLVEGCWGAALQTN